MFCILCHNEEIYQLNGKKDVYRPGKEVISLVCSDCIQRLLGMSQAKLIEAYNLALERGYPDKASFLSSFINDDTEDSFHVSETRKTRPNMVRERFMRKVRPSRYRMRT